MKRELDCVKCHMEMKHLLEEEHAGEKVKVVKGKVKAEGICCDLCGDEFKIGQEAYAVSMWLTKSGISYSSWEKSYLESIAE